jgi:hypothetical protein
MEINKNSFVLMPENVEIRNASNERCDMLIGACSCGAWHKEGDWKDKIEKVALTYIKILNT